MKKKTVKWADGARVKADPLVAEQEFQAIAAAAPNELAKKALLVERARDPLHPLHGEFEWDDTVAAEKYRLEQAGYLFRALMVVVENDAQEEREVRLYVNVEKDDDSGWVDVFKALETPEYKKQVMAAAKAGLLAWTERYKDFKWLAGEVAQVAQVAQVLGSPPATPNFGTDDPRPCPDCGGLMRRELANDRSVCVACGRVVEAQVGGSDGGA